MQNSDTKRSLKTEMLACNFSAKFHFLLRFIWTDIKKLLKNEKVLFFTNVKYCMLYMQGVLQQSIYGLFVIVSVCPIFKIIIVFLFFKVSLRRSGMRHVLSAFWKKSIIAFH